MESGEEEVQVRYTAPLGLYIALLLYYSPQCLRCRHPWILRKSVPSVRGTRASASIQYQEHHASGECDDEPIEPAHQEVDIVTVCNYKQAHLLSDRSRGSDASYSLCLLLTTNYCTNEKKEEEAVALLKKIN